MVFKKIRDVIIVAHMTELPRNGCMASVPQDCELSIRSLITSAFWATTWDSGFYCGQGRELVTESS